MNKKVLVIIVNYNGLKYLTDCLSSLNRVDYPRSNLEFLVIDNNSTDFSVQYLENSWPQIKRIELENNLGFAGGNNVGFNYAITNNFDYVYLLNQDTVVEPNFLTEAVKVAENDKRIAAVQSKLLLYQDKQKINSIGNEIHYLGFAYAGGYGLPDQELAIREITYPSGAGVLLAIAALKQVGFFNEEFFMYHEDVDLGWRFWLYNYKVVLAPLSIVYHKYEFSRSISKYYYMERNRYLVILQNYRLPTLILISPTLILMELALFFYSFFSGWWRHKIRVLVYFLNFKSWLKIYKTRRLIQKNRQRSDSFVIQKFVGKIEFQDLTNPVLQYLVNPAFNLYWQLVKRMIWW